MLFDIFCVKKIHKFIFEQRAEYGVNDFQRNVWTAECHRNLGKIGDSEIVNSDVFRIRLQSVSLYPRWLIDDDLFDLMRWIFGVTHFVDHLQKKQSKGQKQRVHVYIIPKRIVSLYDPQKIWEMENMSSIYQSLVSLESKASVESSPQSWAGVTISGICEVIEHTHAQIQTQSDSESDIIILVDRRWVGTMYVGSQTLWVFETGNYEELSALKALKWNHFLGFEFDVGDDVKCWIRFGFGQRLRFYPEFMTSFVPSLFVRPSGYNDMEYLRKIYDDQYKHGWAVPLDDPVFNSYYKAITGDDHISNNYRRHKDANKHHIERALGFLDYLRRQIDIRHFNPLQLRLSDNDMDSDAVFEDLLVTEEDAAPFIDLDDSNVVIWSRDSVSNLRTALFRWKEIECTMDNVLDLRDCPHLKLVIEHLKTFQFHGNEVTESNLNQFNLKEVIQSLDHITTVHRLLDPEHRAEIHRYIAGHIACENLKCCELFKKYAHRRREYDQIGVRRSRYKAIGVENQCTVMMDVMHSLHSLLTHRDQTLNIQKRFNRFQNSKEVIAEETLIEDRKEEEPVTNSIDLGVSVIRWIPFGERPHFQTFRDEIVGNPEGSINEQLFHQYLVECIAKIHDTTFTLKEMMALKLYTDTTKFTAFLRKAHWTTSRSSCKKMYYFWASALYEAALYHSTPIDAASGNTPETLYHGMNRMFTLNEELPKYHGPFSSTRQRSIAHEFTKGQGLYFRIQPSYTNKLKCCIGIRVESISHHKREREVLLVDQFLPIVSAKTFKNTDTVLVDYFMFSVKMRRTEIKDRRSFFTHLGIRFDPEWMPLIGKHSELFVQSVYENRKVITRLVDELKIIDWKLSFLNQDVDHKQLLIYLVEQCKMKQLLPFYRVATSEFRVLQSFVINRCFEIEVIPNTKMDHIGDEMTVNDSCFKETEYRINGDLVPFTTSSVEGVVHRIQCRNNKLFGDRDVFIQEFEPLDDNDSLKSEIMDFVENRNIHELLPHYRVMTSKFNVVQSNYVEIS